MKSTDIRFLAFIGIVAVASFSVTFFLLGNPPSAGEEVYRVDNSGLVYANRPPVSFQQEVWNESEDSIVYRVWFESHGGANVYGLLAYPKMDGPLPAFFVLPGATVTKEGEYSSLGKQLVEMGYVVMTLDQRGHGETKESGGVLYPFNQDYLAYVAGEEATHHMAVYDALRAYDLLNSLDGIDNDRIYAAGESMGGNYAMVAAGTEPGIDGLMLISSAGYRFSPQSDPGLAGYLTSISGLNYIDRLSPRPLLMIHDTNDEVVPFGDAQQTFGLAKEPKELLTVTNGTHSYSPVMKGILEEGLEGW